MGRKRKADDEKKVTFHLSVTKKIIDDFKKEVEEQKEVPSRIIEKLIIDYLQKNKN